MVNLVSDRDSRELWERHVKDSLSLLPWFECTHEYLDVGSGGGFPAIPLAIMRPDLRVTLVERSARKCRFLEQAVMHLPLVNVAVEEVDIRNFTPTNSFDTITARAVANPSTVWQWTKRLLKSDGELLLQTSQPVEDELPEGKIRRFAEGYRGCVTAVARSE